MPVKTSDSIEAQEERKAARDNTDDHPFSRVTTPPVREKLNQRDASRIAKWRWQPGQSGNPTGKRTNDLAKELATAIFEQNGPALYRAYLKAALKGNGCIFEVLSNRALGKLKESIQHEILPYRELTDEALRERIAKLERELGIPSSAPELLPSESETKPN